MTSESLTALTKMLARDNSHAKATVRMPKLLSSLKRQPCVDEWYRLDIMV